MKLGIIGGGVLGLTLALRRAEAGDEVTIFEKGSQPGGLAVSFPVSDRPDSPFLEKFYHHIFQTDKDIIRLIEEMGLTPDLIWQKPPTSILRGGKTFRFDGAIEVLKFKPIPIWDRLRVGMMAAYLKFESNYKRLEKFRAAEWIRKWGGKNGFEAIWKPLLTNKFGTKYDQIALPWFWSRIHERTPFLGYLKGGFHQLYLKLYETVLARGGKVLLNSNVTSIKPAEGEKVLVTADGKELIFDKLVVTTPTRVFTQLARESLPEDYLARYTGPNSVEHYSAQCLILSLDRKLMETYWLNLNDPGIPFLALVEHTSMMPPADYDGQHLLYLGNYLPNDHPLLTKPKEEILAEFLPHLKKVNPAFETGWVKQSWLWNAPFAQPIVTLDYKDKLPPHQTPLPNVLLANMAHVYPQDRGQNYSIKLGEKIAKML